MNIFSRIFAVTEADIVKLITLIKTDETIFLDDLEKAADWIMAQAPVIVADIQMVTKFAATVGVTAHPEFAAAVLAANAAVTALNAMVNSKADGASTEAAVVQGYIALKQATASVSTAAAVVAGK